MDTREKVWPTLANPEMERAAEHLFDHVCRHLVCLAIRYVFLDDKGKPYGQEYFIAYSGFVMSIQGIWFLVTAGHILKEELDENLANKKIQIIDCSLGDYFGKDAKVRHPTPFPYEDAVRAYVDERELGLDVGLIYLRPLFKDGLAANGIIPITEKDWLHQHEVEFEAYQLLGFPKELVDKNTKPVQPGEYLDAVVAPVLISAKKIDDLSGAIPSSVEIPPSAFPWFVGKLIPPQIPSIKGMSGGPILGYRATPDGGLRYWVVAVQSRWYEESRIILGCPVPIFADLVRRTMQGKLPRSR